jgi:hypothetical protein
MGQTAVLIEVGLLVSGVIASIVLYINIIRAYRMNLKLCGLLQEAYEESPHTIKCFSNDRRAEFCICWKHETERLLDL